MYVHAYIRTYVRMYVRTYVRTCVRVYVCTYVRTRMYVCMYVCPAFPIKSSFFGPARFCGLLQLAVQKLHKNLKNLGFAGGGLFF